MQKPLDAVPHPSSSRANAKAETCRPGTLPTLVEPRIDAEALLRSTLDALSAHIAVLDEAGIILFINQAWKSFADASGYTGPNHAIGTNYLSVCDQGAESSVEAGTTARALREILAGTRRGFRMEYPCESPRGPRWFQVRMTRPQYETSRIVVAHEDITEVKLAEEALNRLSARLLQMQDDERRNIARELHDTTAQNLLAMTLNAARLRDPLRQSDANSRILGEIIALGEQSLQEVRTLSYLLHPPLLDEMGLPAALRWLCKGFSRRSGIEVETDIDDRGLSLSREAATALFRVAQEALSNVHRHSGSPSARLSLQKAGQTIRLAVADRGAGLASRLASAEAGNLQNLGVGIAGMRVRLEQLGGILDIESGPSGTEVIAVLPVEGDGAAQRP
jgi:two-component system NarL family sensor kinase